MRGYLVSEKTLLSDEEAQPVVLKIASHRAQRKQLKAEHALVTSLNHPGIIKPISLSALEQSGKELSVMSLPNRTRGDLLSLAMKGKLSTNLARHLFTQIVKAVDYMHSEGVVHCDLKLDNVLLTDDGTTELIDFELAL